MGDDGRMDYKKTTLTQKINITGIITVHYFEYSSSFFFPGEAHDFWEFLYVDKGEVSVTADTNVYQLKQGEIIFHKPKEFHNLRANGVVAPNLVVIAFECKSPQMRYFENALLRIDSEGRDLIAKIIVEACNAYASSLDDPQLKYLKKRKQEGAFASEQLLKLYLETFLIQMIRKDGTLNSKTQTTTTIKEYAGMDLVNRVIIYLREHLRENITLDDICKYTLSGRSHLQKLFREKTGGGVIEYFNRMKIETAKQMMREGKYNFTQLSEYLGYSSVCYFSRVFKKATGMSPSEYSSSIKIRTMSPYQDLKLNEC